MTKITERNYHETIISILTGKTELTEQLGATLVKYAEGKVAALDARNEKAKEAAAKKKVANDELADRVAGVLTADLVAIADIVTALGDPAVTQGMVINRLTKLVTVGRAVKGEISIPATEGVKARKISAYRLA
jgi:hypothetical protein